jgi:penicillin-binding protein 2
MNKRISIKNPKQEIQLITSRSILTLILIGMLMVGLIVRLFCLQLIERAHYTTLSNHNWLELVPIEPTRGLIYDRHGVLLAENIPVFSVDIIPNQTPHLNETLTQLGALVALQDNDLTQFQKQLKQHRRFDEIPLKLKLTEQEVARISENQYRLPGVLIKARLMRHYPQGESFSHVIGYVGRINAEELQNIDAVNYSANYYIGKAGVEKFYEDALHGRVGYEQVEKEASGKPIRTLKTIQAVPGKNIYLTIDAHLQTIAEQALNDHRGAVVAIDPNNGQILALVSKPTFDPNLFVQGIPQKEYDILKNSPDRPLFNRVIRGLYPMASTIKPYLALEALRANVTDPDATFFDPGWFSLPSSSHIFHDWQKKGHGWVNLERAIISSCDTYFYQLAYKMGIQRIDTVLAQFGFGKPTGVDLEGELPGIVASPDWKYRIKGIHWYPGDTVISGIGQGFMLATPLQLAEAISTLANRGKQYAPYLKLGEQIPGQPPLLSTPIAFDAVTLEDTNIWKRITDAMQGVATSPQGTGFRFGQHAYSVAMKTGTAQVVAKHDYEENSHEQDRLPERLRDHHLLIVFAPADQPRIALAIITENSNQTLQVARRMLDYYLLGKMPNVATTPPAKIQA